MKKYGCFPASLILVGLVMLVVSGCSSMSFDCGTGQYGPRAALEINVDDLNGNAVELLSALCAGGDVNGNERGEVSAAEGVVGGSRQVQEALRTSAVGVGANRTRDESAGSADRVDNLGGIYAARYGLSEKVGR